MKKEKEKKSPAEKLTGVLQKKFGLDSALLLGKSPEKTSFEVCPSGVTVLDKHVLGVGGLPYGRIVEMYGGEGSGKTTLMNKFLASVQREGGLAVLIETEQKYDPEWARLHGVDLDGLLLLQPSSLEDVLERIETVVNQAGKTKMVIALDSIAATPTRVEVENGVADEKIIIAEAARIWSRALRVLPKLVSKHKVLLLLINQIRTRPGVMYGNPEVTPAGNAIKHHVSIRLSVGYGKKDGETARFMSVQTLKNQMCPPWRKASLRLDFHTGFDDDWSILNHAKDMGAVENKCQSVKEARKNLGWELVENPG